MVSHIYILCLLAAAIDGHRVFFHLGSPWGAGTFSAADGSRQPTPLELEMANIQGKAFWERVSAIKF